MKTTVENCSAVDAKGLANLLLDWAEADAIPISPMKLQKLLFFAHADFLARFRKPLIKQEFEAWDHGPVLPSIFHEFKEFSKTPITTRAQKFNPISECKELASCLLKDSDLESVRAVYDFYKPVSASELSRMSHDLEGAWRQARSLFANGLNMGRRISDDLIISFHRPIHS